jgi:GTPase-activating protein SAC7
MTTSNLAAIFQPGILSHPQHAMSPVDYRLNQDVLIFLIDNQDHFLIGMEGTAVDENTVKHVESGPSTPQARTPTTPGRNKSGLGRSASAASSAGAESIRKYGGVRRNVSTSSRHSRHSGAVPSPTTPSFTPSTGSGVHRSNTLPSQRSPAVPSSRFKKDKGSDPPTPGAEEAKSALATAPPQVATALPPQPEQQEQPVARQFPPEKLDVVRPRPADRIELPRPTPTDVPGAYPLPSPGVPTPASEDMTPTAPAAIGAAQVLVPPPQQHGRRSPQLTPTREKSEFMEGPVDSGTPVELTPAVRTFTQILSAVKVSPSGEEKKDGRKPNKLQKRQRGANSANPSAHSSTHSLTGANIGLDAPPSPLPPLPTTHNHPTDTVSSRNSGATLKPSMSPSASFRSHSTATEYSEAEQPQEEPLKEEKRSFWRSHKRGESKATPTASQTDLSGSIPGADKSMSSFGSSSGWGGRRSLQYDSHDARDMSMPYGSPESKEHEKKGISGWFHGLRQEHKEREAKKQRAKSPPGSASDLLAQQNLGRPNVQESFAVRGKSMDVPRSDPPQGEERKGSDDVTPTGTSPNPPLATVLPPTPSTSTSPPTNPVSDTHPPSDKPALASGPAESPNLPPNTTSDPNSSTNQAGGGPTRSMLDV